MAAIEAPGSPLSNALLLIEIGVPKFQLAAVECTHSTHIPNLLMLQGYTVNIKFVYYYRYIAVLIIVKTCVNITKFSMI